MGEIRNRGKKGDNEGKGMTLGRRGKNEEKKIVEEEEKTLRKQENSGINKEQGKRGRQWRK